MDLICPKCGEPWDLDEFHEVSAWGSGRSKEFDEALTKLFENRAKKPVMQENQHGLLRVEVAVDLFKRLGCGAFGWNSNCPDPKFNRPEISAIYEILGDDTDGAAAFLEDMGS